MIKEKHNLTELEKRTPKTFTHGSIRFGWTPPHFFSYLTN